ncbi:MAG: hypothetical protein U0892_05320 [Pirellulales bacterium]
MSGTAPATLALILGYTSLCISSFFLLCWLVIPLPKDGNDGRRAGPITPRQKQEAALRDAEIRIAFKAGEQSGRGNSPEAIALAQKFSEKLKFISDAMFTASRKPILEMSGGDYVTYCELHEDRCLFLVHVPSYRKFTSDAKETLAVLAWTVAESTASSELPENSRLAVGLHGAISYGDIMIGQTSDPDDEKTASHRKGSRDDLIQFFEADMPEIQDMTDENSSENNDEKASQQGEASDAGVGEKQNGDEAPAPLLPNEPAPETKPESLSTVGCAPTAIVTATPITILAGRETETACV